MFTVKATYNNETRRFTVKDSSFPSFDTIQSQLYRVFPIRGSYYLSRLMFCPSEGSRVVVGKEVHNEAQYNEHIAPFSGRLWPNGLLRFNVVDEIPHKQPFAPSVSQVSSDSPFSTRLSLPIPRHAHAPASAAMDVDDDVSATAASDRYSMFSQTTQQSCRSVSEGKEQMKELVTNFLRDFNNVMSSTFGEAPTAPAAELSSPETVVPEQKNADDNGDVTIPGAFVNASTPSSVPTTVEKPVHEDVLCDQCNTTVRGTRYRCLRCHNFDLCEECVERRNAKAVHQISHAEKEGLQLHPFAEIAKPGDPSITSGADSRDASPGPIHHGIVCDICDGTIAGTRHKCLDCRDFDLCDKCFTGRDVYHPEHEFISFKTPRWFVIHDLQRDAETPRPDLARLDTNVSSNVVHHANCDLCDSRILGVRYKCLTCPDYDTCASCYIIVPEQHPRHAFVKLETPQDLAPRNPSAYKKHNARCNECGSTIRGVRYKCLHPECPDYDLCSKCEAFPIEVHPALHPLVKLRSPDVVIPTVYQVGGTTLLDPLVHQPATATASVETDPAPEKADASVHAETNTEKTDAAVSTVTDAAPEATERSVVLPVLPSPPAFAPGIESMPTKIQQFADIWRGEASKINNVDGEEDKKTTEMRSNMPTFSSLLTNFLARRPLGNQALYATFVSDVNIEDGQVFPAGAEFVKSWRMRNDGEVPWPNSTCVVFVAGNRMPGFAGAPLSYHVGSVETGQTVDVIAYGMKAPDVPGKYVGYWRLSDGTESFGQSVWCEISVPIPSGPPSAHESLAASEVVMPEPSHARTSSISCINEAAAPDLVFSTSVPATPTMSGPSTDVESADSLLDEFDTASDEDWDALREHASAQRVTHGDTEYVVLYDEQSTDDEGH